MTGRMDEGGKEKRRETRPRIRRGRVQTSDMGVLPMHCTAMLQLSPKILKLFLFYSFIEVISAVYVSM